MAKSPSIVLFVSDTQAAIKRLSLAEKGELFDAILDFRATGDTYSGDNQLVGIAFDVISEKIGRTLEQEAERSRAMSENGKMGGRPRKTEKAAALPESNSFSEKPEKAEKASYPIQSYPIQSDPIQSDPIQSENDDDNDYRHHHHQGTDDDDRTIEKLLQSEGITVNASILHKAREFVKAHGLDSFRECISRCNEQPNYIEARSKWNYLKTTLENYGKEHLKQEQASKEADEWGGVQ